MAVVTDSPFPSFTKTWHNTTYAAIYPTRPELSAKGKSILITGGGTGIGAAIASGFAAAGASNIALTGRTQATLSRTADHIKNEFKSTHIKTYITDVADESSVRSTFQSVLQDFGNIDICISNAGFSGEPAFIVDSELDVWTKSITTNILGPLFVARAFVKIAKEGAVLLNTSSGMSHMTVPGTASYAITKTTGNRIFEFVAAENPHIHVVNVQPGVINTSLSDSTLGKGNALDFDDLELPGHFYVWLASPEAKFLVSKFVWVNWDVEELIAMKDQIKNTELLSIGLDVGGISFRDWSPADAARFNKSS